MKPDSVKQTSLNLETASSVNEISTVGKFTKGESEINPEDKLYLKYPGLSDLLGAAQAILKSNKKVLFKCPKAFEHSDIKDANFLSYDSKLKKELRAGLKTSIFGSLLTTNLTGQKVLGNFSLAFIEGKALNEYHKHHHGDEAIDHFYCIEGVSNLTALEDIVKTQDLKKNQMAVVALPDNAIKAFRRNKFSGWQVTNFNTETASLGKVILLDESDNKTGEISLIEQEITNLDSPIYKVKIGERWVLVLPLKTSYKDLNQGLQLELSNNDIACIKENEAIVKDQNLEASELECSPGQAARVIFELFGGDFELIPEAMLNFEGGSWSSIVTEKSSSGRHCGINNMHEVLKHGWYKNVDVAIPWNYVSFDRLDENNQSLVNQSEVFQLCFEKYPEIKFIECPQNWKKAEQELLQYVAKFVYREYSTIGSKKYLLSTKELMLTAARFLANLAINEFDRDSEAYKTGLEKLNLQSELAEFMDMVADLHLMLNSRADFYSAKTNPYNIERLKNLAKIHNKLEKFCPVSVRNFTNKVKELLTKDSNSESISLFELYRQQLQTHP